MNNYTCPYKTKNFFLTIYGTNQLFFLSNYKILTNYGTTKTEICGFAAPFF
jgi:hypothetical protein